MSTLVVECKLFFKKNSSNFPFHRRNSFFLQKANLDPSSSSFFWKKGVERLREKRFIFRGVTKEAKSLSRWKKSCEKWRERLKNRETSSNPNSFRPVVAKKKTRPIFSSSSFKNS